MPIGQIGEILIRRGFMWGYWGRPTATKKVLKNGWLHTGDVGRMDEDGYVFLMARKSERIHWGKRIVYPRLVEEALYFDKAVQYSALIPVPDKKMGEIPKAIVSLYPGKKTTEEALRNVVKKQLSASDVPPGHRDHRRNADDRYGKDQQDGASGAGEAAQEMTASGRGPDAL